MKMFENFRKVPGYRPAKIPRPTNVPGRQLTKRAPAPGQTHMLDIMIILMFQL